MSYRTEALVAVLVSAEALLRDAGWPACRGQPTVVVRIGVLAQLNGAVASAVDGRALEPSEHLVLRWALRDLLHRNGVASNPVVGDDWIVDELARLLRTDTTYAAAERAVALRMPDRAGVPGDLSAQVASAVDGAPEAPRGGAEGPGDGARAWVSDPMPWAHDPLAYWCRDPECWTLVGAPDIYCARHPRPVPAGVWQSARLRAGVFAIPEDDAS